MKSKEKETRREFRYMIRLYLIKYKQNTTRITEHDIHIYPSFSIKFFSTI